MHELEHDLLMLAERVERDAIEPKDLVERLRLLASQSHFYEPVNSRVEEPQSDRDAAVETVTGVQTETLIQGFFVPIAKHMKEHVARLEPLFDHGSVGNENWLKSEAAYALNMAGKPIKSMHGKGPDLCLSDGSLVELKSGTDWNVKYVLNGLKYQTPCLFLMGGPSRGAAKFLERLEAQSRVLACRRFASDAGEWVLGLIAPLGSPQ